RLAAEERQDHALRRDGVEPSLGPARNSLGGLERHLHGMPVVVAVVSLEAVVAREVALQRRQNRDPQLFARLPELPEELLELTPVRLTAFDDEAVFLERRERLGFLRAERVVTGAHAIQHVCDIS